MLLGSGVKAAVHFTRPGGGRGRGISRYGHRLDRSNTGSPAHPIGPAGPPRRTPPPAWRPRARAGRRLWRPPGTSRAPALAVPEHGPGAGMAAPEHGPGAGMA